jgi:hypothetical protein
MSDNSRPDHWLVNLVSLTVVAVWLASVADALIEHEYHVLEAATPIMVILTGYAFGISISRKNGRK